MQALSFLYCIGIIVSQPLAAKCASAWNFAIWPLVQCPSQSWLCSRESLFRSCCCRRSSLTFLAGIIVRGENHQAALAETDYCFVNVRGYVCWQAAFVADIMQLRPQLSVVQVCSHSSATSNMLCITNGGTAWSACRIYSRRSPPTQKWLVCSSLIKSCCCCCVWPALSSLGSPCSHALCNMCVARSIRPQCIANWSLRWPTYSLH